MLLKGNFEIKMDMQPPYFESEGLSLSRMSAQKVFQGDLAATSEVQMMAARTAEVKSAGYVAMEFVEGTIAKRTGSFVLQHSGIMTAQSESQTVVVVPDSATGELKGMSGKMMIQIVDGKHFYEFDVQLPEMT